VPLKDIGIWRLHFEAAWACFSGR